MKIFLAGHKGLVGSAILRNLKKKGYKEIVTVEKKKLNLLNQANVFKFIKKHKPQVVIIAAARVGGIHANSTYGGKFIYENLQIQNNLIHSSYLNGIKNLIFLGSSCIYPKFSKQPIKEDYLLSGKLEESNEPYAVAKIAGIKMCEAYNVQYKTNYKCLMPANTYGPNDSYDLMNSHFFPALIRKAHLCKIKKNNFLEVWGTGQPYRELIYVDDVADACVYFMNKRIKGTLINIGTGVDMKIKEYAKFLIKKLDLKVKIKFNSLKPDGTKRKVLDVSRAKRHGWVAKTSLEDGFNETYKNFLNKFKNKK